MPEVEVKWGIGGPVCQCRHPMGDHNGWVGFCIGKDVAGEICPCERFKSLVEEDK